MRKLVKILGMLPLIWFGLFFVLRVLMEFTEPKTREEMQRATQAHTLAQAVCQTDIYTAPTPESVSRFIDAGGDVNQRVPAQVYGLPPVALIARAADCGHADVVALLLERGAHADEVRFGDVVAFGSDAMAKLLLEHGARLDAPWQPNDASLGTALIQAAVIGRKDWLLEQLVAAHADVQVVNGYGAGLIALALEQGGQDLAQRVGRLIKAGAHVDALRDGERVPLVIAAFRGDTQSLGQLLDAGAKVDATMASRQLDARWLFPAPARVNALSAAAYECHVDIVERLLRAGATKPEHGASGGSLAADTCWEAFARTADPPAQEKIRTMLGVSLADLPGAAKAKPDP